MTVVVVALVPAVIEIIVDGDNEDTCQVLQVSKRIQLPVHWHCHHIRSRWLGVKFSMSLTIQFAFHNKES